MSKAAKEDEAEVATLITREEAMKRLSVSYNEIRRRELKGELKPVKRGNGRGKAVHYRLVDVEAIRDRRMRDRSDYTTEEASIVFDALEKGLTPTQIVVQKKIEPRAVETLALTYSHMTGGMFVPADVLRMLNSLDIDGPVPMKTHEDLREVIEALVKAPCLECEKRPRQLCKHCVQNFIKSKLQQTTDTDEL